MLNQHNFVPPLFNFLLSGIYFCSLEWNCLCQKLRSDFWGNTSSSQIDQFNHNVSQTGRSFHICVGLSLCVFMPVQYVCVPASLHSILFSFITFVILAICFCCCTFPLLLVEIKRHSPSPSGGPPLNRVSEKNIRRETKNLLFPIWIVPWFCQIKRWFATQESCKLL